MIDAAPRRQIPAEPLPDSRMSALARRVGTVTTDLTKTFVPSAKTAGWIIAAVFLGMWVQGRLGEVQNLRDDYGEIKASIDALGVEVRGMRDDRIASQQALIEARGEIHSLTKEIERFELEYRLFEDKVWGRVHHMPYTNPGRRSQAE
jgi:hypothetical protein